MGKLTIALSLLIAGDPLPERYGDHPLSGNWKGFRDMHLEPDWLLLYRTEDSERSWHARGFIRRVIAGQSRSGR